MLGRISVTLALGLVLSLAAGRSDAAGRQKAAIPAPASGEYDLLIEHGRIIDGTGSPWYAGEVAIRDGRSVARLIVRCSSSSTRI